MSKTNTLTKKEKTEIFNEEFLPHADALYNFAYHLTYEESTAQDLVQETFLKAFRYAGNYRRGTNAKAWLFRILKNGFINDYRKKSRRPNQVDFEDFINYQDQIDKNRVDQVDLREIIFESMLGDEITDAINSLSMDFRTVILLSDIEGFSYEDISKIVDIPIGTVRSRLHRARNALKKQLKEYAQQQGFKTEKKVRE